MAIRTWKAMVSHAPPVRPKVDQLMSILIPVRNEAQNIRNLLEVISYQNFPSSQFEVIVVDDHSEDGTAKIVQELKRRLPYRLTLMQLSDSYEKGGPAITGKKQALQLGIKKANGEIIVTTDGDCSMKKDWLQSIYHYFTTKDVVMLIGPVTFHRERSLFEHLQTIEFAALTGIGATSLQLGFPNMSNGANLAFRKNAFLEVGGYTDNIHIPSGDDEFLLQKIFKRFPGRVLFNTSPSGIVYTRPAGDLRTFFHQRKRWSGKWKLHKTISIKLLAVFIFLYHLLTVWTFFLSLGQVVDPLAFAILFILKIVFEFVFIRSVLLQFNKTLYIKHFVALQGIYSFYVLIFGVLANFGSFDWKGRKFDQ